MDQMMQFESYLSGRMTEEDRIEFENKIQTDTATRAALEEHIKMQQSFDILLEDDIKGVISEIDTETKAVKEGSKFKWMVMAIAACLAVGIVIGSLFLSDDKGKDMTQLMAMYYKKDLSSAVRGDAGQETVMYEAYAQGHTDYQQGEYEDAIKNFEKSLNVSDVKVKQRAEWFLSLSLLSSNPARAESILTAITQNPDHIKYPEAIKLLKDLGRSQ